MNLETQVVSIALAKEMAELGFEQDSLFSWIVYEDKTAHIELTKWAKTQYVGIGIKESVLYAAYTVAELGEILPYSITLPSQTVYFLKCGKVQQESDWTYVHYTNLRSGLHYTQYHTEANARAKMCIWLRKEKFI